MSDYHELLVSTVDELLAKRCTPDVIAAAESDGWASQLWAEIDGLGLARIGVEGAKQEALDVVRLAGRYAAPVPLADTILATLVDPSLPPGPATVAAGGRAAYGRFARHVVGDAQVVQHDVNCAGEPWDRVDADGLDVLLPVGALVRSAQIAGALAAVLELTCGYAEARMQFGRPIARFQAVQRHLVTMAGEVQQAGVAVDRAIASDADFDVAVAKVRCGVAAGCVAALAHQVHGAMGVTHEYRLHQLTRRLWAWRDEFGTETQWAVRLGRSVLAMGAAATWEAAA